MNLTKRIGRSLLCCLLLIAVLVTVPIPASAAEKYMEGKSANVSIMLDKSGGADVLETWECFFGGDTITRYRRHYTFPEPCSMTVQDIWMDGEPMTILDAPDDSRPEGCAAVYQEGNTTHVELYLSACDETHTFDIFYYVTDAVILYDDVAEFHWNLTSEEEAYDIEVLTGSVDIPYGTEDHGLYFWGHGPTENAWFDAMPDEDGMVSQFLLYSENIPKDRAVTVRFAMPLELFPQGTRFVSGMMLDQILEEEHALAGIETEPDEDAFETEPYEDSDDEFEEESYEDPYADWTAWDEALYTIEFFGDILLTLWGALALTYCFSPFIVLPVARILARAAAVGYLRRKYEKFRPKPAQAPEYYRSLPDDLKPAMVYKLMSFYPATAEGKKFRKKGNAFSATILDLVERGLIEIGRNEGNEVTYFVPEAAQTAELNESEQNMIALYLTAGAGQTPMSTTEMTTYMRNNYGWCKDHYHQFDRLINLDFDELSMYTEFPCPDWSRKKRMIVGVANGLFIFVGVTFMLGLVAGVVLGGVMGFVMQRLYEAIYSGFHPGFRILTQDGENSYALWKAYAKYLEDFTLFREKEVTDVKIWRKYLVYATALGCSDRVLENLKMTLPEVYESFAADPYLCCYEDMYTSVSAIDTEGGYTIRSESSSSSSGGDSDGDWGGFSDSGGDSDSGSSGSDFD